MRGRLPERRAACRRIPSPSSTRACSCRGSTAPARLRHRLPFGLEPPADELKLPAGVHPCDQLKIHTGLDVVLASPHLEDPRGVITRDRDCLSREAGTLLGEESAKPLVQDLEELISGVLEQRVLVGVVAVEGCPAQIGVPSYVLDAHVRVAVLECEPDERLAQQAPAPAGAAVFVALGSLGWGVLSQYFLRHGWRGGRSHVDRTGRTPLTVSTSPSPASCRCPLWGRCGRRSGRLTSAGCAATCCLSRARSNRQDCDDRLSGSRGRLKYDQVRPMIAGRTWSH